MKKCLFSFGFVAGSFLLPVSWCIAETTATGVATNRQPVVVEVVGYGIQDEGQSVAEVHREALEDALKNAVLQAHVSLDVQILISDLRTKERSVRSRSFGYVEQSRVIDTGFLPDANPPIYRVRMEAHVLPRPGLPVVPVNRVVALNVWSKLEPVHERRYKEALSESLQVCGFRVVDSKDESPRLIVNVTLAQSADSVAWELQWEMERVAVVDPAERHVIDTAKGMWLIPDPHSALEMDKLGEALAQYALRLTGMPRSERIAPSKKTPPPIF